MYREGGCIPRIMIQALNLSEKEKGMWGPPLSPLLTHSQGCIHHGEETGWTAPGHAPSTLSTPIIPYLLPWALPSCLSSPGTHA